MNCRQKLALSTSTLLLALLASASAAAAGVSVLDANRNELNDAKVPYLDGVKYMNSKHYKEAVEKFRESYNIVASPNSRLMLGRALIKVNKPLDAYREFEETVAQATELAGKQAKYQKTADAARKELDDVKVELAFITVIPGTEVSIGGRKLSDADWGKPLAVMPGKVMVEITATDGRIRKKRLRLEPGITRVLTADLTAATNSAGQGDVKDDSDKEEKEQKSEESASSSSSATSGGLNRRTVAYISGGIGIAGIAGGIGMLIAANSIYGDTTAKCNKGGANYCSRVAVDNAEGKGQYEGFGYTALGVGIVGLAAGAYLYFTDSSSSESAAAPRKGKTSVQVGLSSLSLQRTF
jgi:hypothetical protein